RTTTMRRIVLIATAVTLGIAGARIRAQVAGDKPAFVRAPDALDRVTWRTRTLVGDDRLTQWKLAVPATGTGTATFLDAVVRADAAIVDFVEGSSSQMVSRALARPLDYRVSPEER